jgi:uncharacterized membrane protein
MFFENKTSRPIRLAFSYYQQTNTFKGWYSEGWWKMEPGEKIQVTGGQLTQKYYYFFACNDKGEAWEGDSKILVHPTEAFKIQNANLEYVKEQHAAYQWRKFRKADVGSSKKFTFSFTESKQTFDSTSNSKVTYDSTISNPAPAGDFTIIGPNWGLLVKSEYMSFTYNNKNEIYPIKNSYSGKTSKQTIYKSNYNGKSIVVTIDFSSNCPGSNSPGKVLIVKDGVALSPGCVD